MWYERRPIEDRDEWAGIAARSESGAFSMTGFVTLNASAPASSPRRLVTDERVARAAYTALQEEFGWWAFPPEIAVSPLRTQEPLVEEQGHEDRTVPREMSLGRRLWRVNGGWWMVVPVDYPDMLHDPDRPAFRVRARGRDVELFARELAEVRSGMPTLPEFAFTGQMAVLDGTLHVFDDNPEAGDILRAIDEEDNGDEDHGPTSPGGRP